MSNYIIDYLAPQDSTALIKEAGFLSKLTKLFSRGVKKYARPDLPPGVIRKLRIERRLGRPLSTSEFFDPSKNNAVNLLAKKFGEGPVASASMSNDMLNSVINYKAVKDARGLWPATNKLVKALTGKSALPDYPYFRGALLTDEAARAVDPKILAARLP